VILGKWSERAPKVPWWGPGRVLRVATDCTGLAVPEMALEMLATRQQSDMTSVFGCDVWSGSRTWLKSHFVEPLLGDMTMRVWHCKEGTLTTKMVDGEVVTFERESASIDIYVCGFCCTPFTPNGQRKEWQDEHSKTFWSALKTIATLQPRCFVLENVCAIANNTNSKVVDNALSKLASYIVHKVKVDTKDFGVPHHRPRVYIIGLRRDAMKSSLAEASPDVLGQVIDLKLAGCSVALTCNFRDFVTACGYPITSNKLDPGSVAPDADCTCEIGSLCELHRCQCELCKEDGRASTKCTWRKSQKTHLRAVLSVQKRRAYLQQWRAVKKDKKLKSAPDFFTLAAKMSLHTADITSPLRRCMLKSLSQMHNIMKPCSVLRLSKSLGRNSLRDDGVIPTLCNGSVALYMPFAAKTLSVPQLLCLTGFHPVHQKQSFEIASQMADSDMDLLIGNAMSMPVVGSVMATALSMLVAG
jgi:site-specific DNA-cytosine methylase